MGTIGHLCKDDGLVSARVIDGIIRMELVRRRQGMKETCIVEGSGEHFLM